MARILVLHGPNLNLLGKREPGLYGVMRLKEVDQQLQTLADQLCLTLFFFQSNSEADLIQRIHDSIEDTIDFIIINPASFTHTSIALRDAMLAVDKPFIEVHLSNIYRRETFRQHSYFSDIAVGVITGLGAEGYSCALRYAHSHITHTMSGATHDGHEKN